MTHSSQKERREFSDHETMTYGTIQFPASWRTIAGLVKDIGPASAGSKLMRHNVQLPHSKVNSFWGSWREYAAQLSAAKLAQSHIRKYVVI